MWRMILFNGHNEVTSEFGHRSIILLVSKREYVIYCGEVSCIIKLQLNYEIFTTIHEIVKHDVIMANSISMNCVQCVRCLYS